MKVTGAKLIALGEPAAGKTAILLRHVFKTFPLDISSSIGTYYETEIELEDDVVQFQLWDTVRLERFRSMLPVYLPISAVLLVFDITQRKSFEGLRNWVSELGENFGVKMVMFVVGNKSDLPNREVSKEEALQYSHSIGATYHECSAKEDQGIEEIFTELAKAIKELSSDASAWHLRIIDTSNPEGSEMPSLKIDSGAHGTSKKCKCY